MYEQLLPWAPWAGLALLAVFCLPIACLQKLVLEVTAWGLRLALLALLAAGAYLWFRPGELPAEVTGVLGNFPNLLAVLPEPGTPAFGLCAATLVVAVFVPLLAVLDVTRKLAGRRLGRLRALTAAPVTAPPPAEPAPMGMPIERPVDRRTAAAAIASAAPRGPARPAGR
jgi:hypothetical protein